MMANTFSDLSDASNQHANIFDQSDVLTPPPRKQLIDENGVLMGTLRLRSAWTSLHPMLPDTPVWAYDGLVPGPTVVVDSGDQVQIRVKNRISTKLPYQHVIVDPGGALPPGDMNQPGGQPQAASTQPGDSEEQQAAANLNACCVMHLHGAATEANSDGWAENVILPGESAVHHYQFRRDTFRTASDGEHSTFEYRGGAAPMFWYHDHAMGATRFNNFAGLAGAWIVRDAIEADLGLPTDEQHELPLILQDRNLDTSDGSPDGELTGRLLHKVQTDVREFFGPATVVSGKLWPRINVDPCVYRLRLLNGSNARYFRLNFFVVTSASDRPEYVKVPSGSIQQIGTDGGLLDQAIDLPADGLVLAPGERADVLIDFGLLAEQTHQVVVFNDAPAPFGDDPQPAASPDLGNLGDLRPIPHVMRFDLNYAEPISGLNGHPIEGMALDPEFQSLPTDHKDLPHHEHSLIVLREEDEWILNADGIPVDSSGNPALDASGQLIRDASGSPIAAKRTMLFLHEMMEESDADATGMNMYKVADKYDPNAQQGIRVTLRDPNNKDPHMRVVNYVTVAKRFSDATTIFIQKGSWHLWKILNLSPDSHPFHIHLTQLQAIGRSTYQPHAAASIPKGNFEFDLEPDFASPPKKTPSGWKDTFRVNPGDRGADDAIVKAEMMTLFGQFSQHAGRYMIHCHILEHEDSDMMRPFVVVPQRLMPFMAHMGMSH